jgi:hypothetical protein
VSGDFVQVRGETMISVRWHVAARLMACVFFALLCGVRTTQADGNNPSEGDTDKASFSLRENNPVEFKLRLEPPLATVRIQFTDSDSYDTVPVLLGGSFGVEVLQFVTFEVGGEWDFNPHGLAHHLFARAGVMPTVIDNRFEKKRQSLQVGGLLGYNYSVYEDNHEYTIFDKYHAVSIGAATEYTIWTAPRFGFCFRFLVEASIPVYEIHSPDAQHHTRPWEMTFGASIGLTFSAKDKY